MSQVGIRELRNHLSRYLERVQAGEEVVVTDRGRAIARVLPIEGERTIDRLIREGLVTPAQRPKQAAPQPLAAALRAADDDLVVVGGDRTLLQAAQALGLRVAATR